MAVQQLLTKKRHGQALSQDEVQQFVHHVITDQLHHSQLGAMLMAMAINGMNKEETATLTREMANSGELLSWKGIVADKHSTGGVGDKISLPLAPILAEIGLTVPMMSGRGLGLTGGTLDKLESIPGLCTSLTVVEMSAALSAAGCFIAATTDNICPADKKLYSIRDVTSTVDSTPLIVSSILSKKIAEGAKYLIQDIKVGESTQCKDVSQARQLAKAMIEVAKLNDLKMAATLTKMDEPIGLAVGNTLEVIESVKYLQGQGPPDLHELVTTLGSELLLLTGLTKTPEEGISKIEEVVRNGAALARFEKMCVGQGVTPSMAEMLCRSPHMALDKATKRTSFTIQSNGWVERIDAVKVAQVCWELGSGRRVPEDTIDRTVGAELQVTSGDLVKAGQEWLVLHHNRPLSGELQVLLASAIRISERQVQSTSRIIETIHG